MDKKYIFDILNLNKLTKEQVTAVLNNNLPILVSASAGSGKTSVLSKRYIYKLLTSTKLKTTQNILVLTFAKSAANEMFERIFNTILNLSKQYPKNLIFKKIKNSISKNLITTIDAFCFNFIKQNFKALNISPNFKLISNLESLQIKDKVLNNLFEIEKKENKEKFQKICNYFKLKDMTGLKNAILKIYDKSKTMPFPKFYIKNLVKQYVNPPQLETSEFLKEIKQDILDKIYEIENILFLSINSLKKNSLKQNFESYIKKNIFAINNIKNKINNISYSELKIILENFKFESFPKYDKKNNIFDQSLADQIKKTYINNAKKIMSSIKENLISNEQYLCDFKKQKRIANAIVNISLKFYSKFENKKKENNILEFSDLITKTLSLLTKIDSNEKIILTSLGKKVSKKFKEVLIDEFQDINKAQNLLIKILSNNNENLFAVGDLKQSIYGFRDSDTSIFLNKKNEYKNNKKGELINLNKNFRSEIEVINTVNFLFSNIMTPNFGKINYKTTEKLESEKINKNEKYTTEIHILKNNEKINNLEYEISHVANIIYNMLKEKFQICENGTIRNCTPKDFAVLFRSDKNAINMLCEKLSKLNINFLCLNNINFLQSYEISILISLLKIVDNPFFDIPFCAVALSPMFNFSNQELLEIKMNNQDKNLFTCFKKSKNRKCKILISMLKELKKISISKNLEYLIHKIYNMNYFLQIFTKTKFDIINSKNLEMFLQITKKYNEYNKFGIAGFIKYLDSIKSENTEINLNSTIHNDAVNIMTIHKSKGLEFPIVILPLTSKKFNEKDFKQPLLISSKFGLTLKNSFTKNLIRCNTIPFNASTIYEKLSQKEEEQRLLYVGTTRAKNKIIFTASDNDNNFEKIKDKTFQTQKDYYINFRSKNSFYDWILSSILNKTNIKLLKNSIKIKDDEFDCQFIIKKIENIPEIKKINKNKTIKTDLNFLDKFEKQIFKNKPLRNKLPNKISVSEIVKQYYTKNNNIKTPLKQPIFSYTELKTPVNIGKITHIFLQYANFKNAEKNLNLEINRLIEKEFITKQESKLLDKSKLKNFFSSHAFHIIKNADKIEREKNFLCDINSNLIFKKSHNEKILIQGIIDCVVEKNNQLTIIDYKTDILNEQKLKQRYKKQIKLYEYAIKKITKKEITQSIIYSTYLNKTIKIQ